MATFVKHTACVSCSSSDALAHYSDGSLYCYSCGYSSRRTKPSFKELDGDEEQLTLPDDCSHDFPEEVYNWIKPTTITIAELIKHDYYYSRRAGGLLRVFWRKPEQGLGKFYERSQRTNAGEPVLDGYELRFLFPRTESRERRNQGPKSKFRGSKEEIFPYSGKENEEAGVQRRLTLVEDSLSSIRVGRHCCSLPLFGSSISNNKLVKAVEQFDIVFVWLDSDKFSSAKLISDRIKMLGKQSSVIYTDNDPKYVDDYLIKEYTNANS